MGCARTPALAVSLLAALALITPTSLAQGQFDARLPDCRDAMCIVFALLGGLVQVMSAIGLGIASIFNALFGGFATSVIQPFFGIFGSAFQGLGSSLATLTGSLFNGVGDAFSEAYFQLQSYLMMFGPVAPIVATFVVGAVVAMVVWGIGRAFDKANDPLPGPIERVVDADDEDDD